MTSRSIVREQPRKTRLVWLVSGSRKILQHTKYDIGSCLHIFYIVTRSQSVQILRHAAECGWGKYIRHPQWAVDEFSSDCGSQCRACWVSVWAKIGFLPSPSKDCKASFLPTWCDRTKSVSYKINSLDSLSQERNVTRNAWFISLSLVLMEAPCCLSTTAAK